MNFNDLKERSYQQSERDRQAEAAFHEVERLRSRIPDALAELSPPTKLGTELRPLTVYYDPAKFRVEAAFDRIHRVIAERHRGDKYNLVSVPDLSRIAISKYPNAEEMFVRRGFFVEAGSMSDVTSFGKGDHRPETRYLAHNRAATYLLYAIIDHLARSITGADVELDPAGEVEADAFSMNGLFIFGSKKATWTEQLDRMMGYAGAYTTSLGERRGILLPCGDGAPVERIHFAHTRRPKLALELGHGDPEGLCSAMPAEICEQVQFERQHSEHFFCGASAAALLLWQTQALAALRKVVWQIEFELGKPLNDVEEETERRRKRDWLKLKKLLIRDNQPIERRVNKKKVTVAVIHLDAEARRSDNASVGTAVEGGRKPAKSKVLDFLDSRDSFLSGQKAATVRAYNHSVGLRSLAKGDAAEAGAARTCALTDEQIIAATVHGSTFRPSLDVDDAQSREDAIPWLQPVAEWIGRLKHQRFAELTLDMADTISRIFDGDDEMYPYDPQLSRSSHLIRDRLGAPAWAVIEAVVEEMLGTKAAASIPIVYEWSRDASEPWKAERRSDGTIVICGPLLDFPVSHAESWNKACQVLQEDMRQQSRRM